MDRVLNISAYLFTPLTDTVTLRATLRGAANARGLKGTILLAEEGINLFLAGEPVDVRAFVDELRSDDRFAALQPKESWSDTQPFGRMLVKLKREIIRMDHPVIRPVEGRAAAVDASTLKRWLDQGADDTGRPVVMLDTRNQFEVEYGTFEGAVSWGITRFGEFPDAASTHTAELEGATVVSFCTGGIRCEKAALYLQEAGHPNVLQLEGGILKYFEEVGGDHWEGDCFVFDEREALTPGLAPARSA
ncbi:sulfurtransferase [Microbacterium lacus]|uniref:sulfurtransferase n=1 Tax=Microbacterium lacus TaxID=415217 RepID=UPI00384C23F0